MFLSSIFGFRESANSKSLLPLFIAGEDSVEVMVVLGKMGQSVERPAQKGSMVSFVR